MDKEYAIKKLDNIVPRYFGDTYRYVNLIRNIFGEPFIIFKIEGDMTYYVTGSELDWEVCDFYNNIRWFSEGDERFKIKQAIEDYEKDNS